MNEFNESNGKIGSEIDPLRAPVAYSRGVGPFRAEILRKLGIFRAFDLLFYFPRDYLEISMKKRVDELVEDEIQSICGTIEDFRTRFSRRGPIVTLNVLVGDDVLQGIWFNQTFVTRSFRFGRRVLLTGKPKKASEAYWQMTHPKLTYLDDADSDDFNDASTPENGGSGSVDAFDVANLTIAPIYPLTEGVTQFQMQRIVKNALTTLPDLLPEAFPQEYLTARNLAPIAEAIRKIHFPATLDEVRFARRRFVYQELLILQLALAVCRARRQINMKAPILSRSGKIDARIRSLFPFELTEAQRAAIAEISADLGRPVPMNRLLQGDVGSGKTVVAVYAMLQAVANGAQAVLMAPTEVLARQHLRTLTGYLRDSSTKIVPLFGGQKATERAAILGEIRDGSAQIVVGTQALVCNEIEFKRLGLVVIDEQHKFGVEQRASLKSTSSVEPHYLVMTATPIPRSLTMTLFGDLDVSTMRGVPPGRRKTTTAILDAQNRASWWNFVREKLREGRQGYVVVPRVDDGDAFAALDAFEARKIENDGSLSSDFDFWNRWEGPEKERALLQAKSKKVAKSTKSSSKKATDAALNGEKNDASDGETTTRGDELKNVWTVYKELSEGELKGFRLGIVHGRLSTAEKEAIMLDFRSGAVQVLIATSVVEVGVDVPNATLMTIENAERFGLAQLHQLRGRIGRGKYPGFCAVAPSDYLTRSNAEPVRSDESKNSAEKLSSGVSNVSTAPSSQGKKPKRSTKKTEKTKSNAAAKSNEANAESAAEERRRAAIRERLEFFARTTDGFELAEKDFELRGPGELFGARQHGSAALRVADLSRDRETLLEANVDAREITKGDPGLAEPKHAALRKQVLARYGRVLDLGDVG